VATRRNNAGGNGDCAVQFLIVILSLLYLVPSLGAQHCSEESAIKARLDGQTPKEQADFIKELEAAKFFGGVMRWTAVAGSSVVPTLRVVSRPGLNFNSIPGEAQISLAKLGDETALKELDDELNHSPAGGYALEKLIRVGTDRAFSILMTFVHNSPWWRWATTVRSRLSKRDWMTMARHPQCTCCG
jgi:hypothetical protein